MATTTHRTTKKLQQAKLRKTLDELYGANYKPVPNESGLDMLPYHASVNTANQLYDRIKARDRDFLRLPIDDWQLTVPRLHCYLVHEVEVAIGFNRHGYLRVAKSFLGIESADELLSAILYGAGRYHHRHSAVRPRHLYDSWFNQLKLAGATSMTTPRRHFARNFQLVYKSFAFTNTPRGLRADTCLDQIVAEERINAPGGPTQEPAPKMLNQVRQLIKRLRH